LQADILLVNTSQRDDFQFCAPMVDEDAPKITQSSPNSTNRKRSFAAVGNWPPLL
jgi:hypothetical protein